MSDHAQWIDHVSELSTERSIDPVTTSHIAAVADGSPAHTLGLVQGDLLLSVDGEHIGQDALLTYLADNTASVEWLFYRRTAGKFLKVVSKSLPLGFDDEISTARILNNVRTGNLEEGLDFERLWQRRAWDPLREAANAFCFDNAFFKFARLFKKDWMINDGHLYKGAALFELGDEEQGIHFVEQFAKHAANDYTSSTHALLAYYLARWAERNGDRDAQQYWLERADDANRGHFKVIDTEVEKKYEGLPVAPYRWKNQELPVAYELTRLEGEGRVSLVATLSAMRDDELLPVCVMPAYRGNGPYDDIMRCYRATYKAVAHRVKPMHVITDVTEKRKDRAFWYENEELARASGVPFEVLYDTERSVSETLEQEFSPVCYVLDKDGVVRSEESLSAPSKIWNLLNLKPKKA